MNNVLKFNKLPSSYTQNYIGSGRNSDCFRIDEKTVFKLLYAPHAFEDCIKKTSKMKEPKVIFPNNLVYEKDSFVGYTMDYKKGVNLTIAEYIALLKYIKEMICTEYSIASISNQKIIMMDLKPSNILYTEDDKFAIIDTDFYNKSNRKKIYQINMGSFAYSVLTPIMDIYSINFINKALNNKKELLIEGKYLPSKFILEVLKELRKEIGYELNTTTDVKTALQFIRK